jgi:hypothetical protein
MLHQSAPQIPLSQLKGKNPHQNNAATDGRNMWLYQSGDVSPRNAAMRADLGKSVDLWNMQVRAGPACGIFSV